MKRLLILKQEITYIYVIKEIEGDKVIYVGKTKNPLSRRASHAKLFDRNKYDIFIIAEFYDELLAYQYEYDLINKYFELKHKLRNKHRYP